MKKSLTLFIIVLATSLITAQATDSSTVVYGNKTYHTIKLGNQIWLKENLDIGTMIKGIQDQTDNGVLEKYCYGDDPANCEKYGALYTWKEATNYLSGSAKVKGICPDGWHIPTLAEFNELIAFVNNDGNSLKEIGQGQGEGTGMGTNTSGFSGMLAGSRGYGGHFSHQNVYLWLWSSNDINDIYTNVFELNYANSDILTYSNGKEAGFCVRCIKDNGTTDANENNIENDLSTSFSLSQNFPNPFNPNTIINYSIPKNGIVIIKVFDVLGNEISVLVQEFKQRGSYSINFDGSKLSSGIYYYQLISGNFIETKKMILIK